MTTPQCGPENGAPAPPTPARKAVTLVETLVVLGIILIVTGMVLAGAQAMRKAARETVCLTRLRDIGLAVTNYTGAFDGTLPMGSSADLDPPKRKDGSKAISETPLSPRGYGSVPGDPKTVYGGFTSPMPSVRDGIFSFQNTREPIWRCPMQPDARGPLKELDYKYADDTRGFRPGYAFMSTLEMRPLVAGRDASPETRALSNKLMAGERLVRNIGGLKHNRIRSISPTGAPVPPTAIVLAYDASPAFHGKDNRSFPELTPETRGQFRINLLYLDGHTETHEFRTRAEFLSLLHPPVPQRWHTEDFESTYAEFFSPPNK